MSSPLVSVMIPSYNPGPYLAEAIDSVLAQTYEPLELIVVDDGSTDGSGEIATGYGTALTYVRQENAGNGAARNTAVAHAHGQLYAFLDADDRFLPTKLERQVSVMLERPEVDIVFGHVREFVSPDLAPEIAERLRAPVPDAPWAAPNLMLIRRESFDRVGLFSTELRVGVTVDWYARSGEQGLVSEMLPEVVLERRLHASNNGIRERDARYQYLHVLKASMDRRRRDAEASPS
ncbi:MAG: glycosyltransferase family 2 protein [Gaiellaceae bacterium]